MSAPENRQISFEGLQIKQVGVEFRLKRDQVEPNLTKQKAIGRGARLIVGFSELPKEAELARVQQRKQLDHIRRKPILPYTSKGESK